MTISQHFLKSVQIGPRGELLVTGSMGSMLSTDGGVQWTLPMALEKLSKTADVTWAEGLGSVVPARDRRGRVYACSKDKLSVIISDNDGKDWTTTEILDKSDPGTTVTVNGGVTSITDINGVFRPLRDVDEIRGGGVDLCAGVVMSGDVPHALGKDGIYWSENRGQSWKGNYHFLGRWARKIPLPAFRLFGDSKASVYTNQHDGMFFRVHRSKDHGATWDKPTFGLTEESIGNLAILRMYKDDLYFVVQPRDSRHTTLYKHHGDATAKLLEFEQLDVSAHANFEFFDIGPKGELVVVGLEDLFTSTNDGATWTTISGGSLMKGSWTYRD